MKNEEIRIIAENYFNQKDTQFLDFKQGQDTKIGFRIGFAHAITNVYKDMENEFNSLLKTSYPKSKLCGYEDALWDLKIIIKDFYGIEMPVITQPKTEKNETNIKHS